MESSSGQAKRGLFLKELISLVMEKLFLLKENTGSWMLVSLGLGWRQ
jgi:hypothetical protein